MGLKRAGEAGTLRRIQPRAYPRDLSGLREQLASGDPATRRWAARDLGDHPDAAGALCERLAVEGDASVRAVLFTAVERIGGSFAVDGLLPLLRSEEPSLRNGAIEVLSGLPQAVAPRIEALLRDDDSDVRIFALNLLGNLPHPDVPRWLAGVLQHEQEPNVVGAALEVLAEVGEVDVVQPLRSVARRFADHPYIAFAAELALQRIEAS